MPAFMSSLQEIDGVGAMALRFAILTAARTNEIVGDPSGEIAGYVHIQRIRRRVDVRAASALATSNAAAFRARVQ
jgi:hypothetical protein